MRDQILVGTLLWALGGMLPASAAMLVADSFAYLNGPLVSVSGGTWNHHSGSTTGEVQVVAGRVLLSQSSTEDVSVSLAGQPYPPATNLLLYASFTINLSSLPTGTGDYFAHFKAAGTSGFADKLFATTNGVPAGFFRVGVAKSANAPSALISSNLSLNTDYTLVTRYAPSDASSALWLNPSGESEPDAVASDTGTTISVSTFALRESGGIGSLAIDNLVIGTSFNEVLSQFPAVVPVITVQPQSQIVSEGTAVSLTVEATSPEPLSYQWQLNNANLAGATNATLTLTNISASQAGAYSVVVSSATRSIRSQPAALTVTVSGTSPVPAFSLLTYNVNGNGQSDWSTNAAQVQAIGRQLRYLQPDIIAFNEIPYTNTWQMPNFVAAYLPGYNLATNSGTDGFVRSVIASRFPIRWSQKWLDGVSLAPFGYSGNFARDLFQAQIAIPGFPQPLEVFVAHLKATTSSPQNDASKRAAEAGAISNFFVTTFLPGTNGLHPYLLAGDLNEDIFLPETNRYVSGHPIQSLVSEPTGLQLTTPLNALTGTDFTESIRDQLNVRFDYILPCSLLASNVLSSQVFRTDLLANPPAPLLKTDDQTASDHLPVLMNFGNPYAKPFRLSSLRCANQTRTLQWETVRGQSYRVEVSSNLVDWSVLANSLTATDATATLATNRVEARQFFRVYRLP
ncbi:MAG TPA: immunoglobulin domain-containing protein [Bacillota bacterium]|nr:immunoglobulin domain-containing protein [Bacillota bacterium]